MSDGSNGMTRRGICPHCTKYGIDQSAGIDRCDECNGVVIPEPVGREPRPWEVTTVVLTLLLIPVVGVAVVVMRWRDNHE